MGPVGQNQKRLFCHVCHVAAPGQGSMFVSIESDEITGANFVMVIHKRLL